VVRACLKEATLVHTIKEFEEMWDFESQATQKQMDQLTDASLSQTVADGHRTLGRLAWHMVTAFAYVMPRTGLEIRSVDAKAPVPESARAIRDAYAAMSKELREQVLTNWNDETLAVVDDIFGEKWERGRTLSVLIGHEVHHRGQMTILMRQAGLKVRGIYGLAKEEFTDHGIDPPTI
jgi:uncharacterized damage-inducible protein DinB